MQPKPEDPATENAKSLQMQMLKAFPQQDHESHIAAHRAFMASRMVQINPMVYALLQGHISDHIALQAHGEIGNLIQQSPEMQQQAQMDPEGFQIQFDSMVAKRIAEITMTLAQEESGNQKQDPLVALKQRELDLRAMDMQRKSQEAAEKLELNADQFDEKIDFERLKLETQDEQSDERLKVAREKMEKQNVKGTRNQK